MKLLSLGDHGILVPYDGIASAITVKIHRDKNGNIVELEQDNSYNLNLIDFDRSLVKPSKKDFLNHLKAHKAKCLEDLAEINKSITNLA
jgi:hypothetical protein